MNEKLLETSLGRVWQHAKSDRPIAILTAFRGEYDHETNLKRNKELAAKIRNLGYGFFFVDGYWIENAGTDKEIHVAEDSIFVVAPIDSDESFKNHMIGLGNTYEQEGVLLKTTDGTKIYDQDGEVIADIGTLKPSKMGDMYTRLRNNKKSNTFVFESERDDIGWIQRLAGITR